MLVVIPALVQHRPVVELSISRLRVQLPGAKFMVICPSCDDYASLSDGTVSVFADDAFAPVSKGVLREALLPAKRHMVGWYYQQLLKYAAVNASQATRVLVLDADTVVLRSVMCEPGTFFTSKERNKAYLRHFRLLFGMDATLRASAIVNFMWFETQALRSMLAAIESAHGKKWWDAIVSIANSIGADVAFSEYETYANWYAARTGTHTEVPIDMFRRGDLLLRNQSDYTQVLGAVHAKGYDAVAFELNHRSSLLRRVATRAVLELGLRRW
jgi:hypothetical protein